MTDGGADLIELADAATSDDAIHALRRAFGERAEVYAIDHAFDALNHYGTLPPVAFTGRIRAELLARRVCEHDGSWWVPIVERDQPVFVVALPDRPEIPVLHQRSLGSLMTTLRNRFDPIERGRRRKTMSVAAELQWALLPVQADHAYGLSVAAVLEPAYDVAGDLFDFAFDDGLWVYSLDGMGHGLEATTAGCVALSAMRNVRRAGGGLAEQAISASRAVRDLTSAHGFVTAVGCRIGPDGSIAVVNAGHEPIRRVGADGVVRLDIAVDRPLGVGATPTYVVTELAPLAPGEGLVFLSDGAAGIVTEDDERLGAERLDAIVEAHWNEIPLVAVHDTGRAVMSELTGRLGDDITIVAVRRDRATGA
ncbi:MAG: SpoIIE family protein phosphatase [Ilumatobacteraceae bacterium]